MFRAGDYVKLHSAISNTYQGDMENKAGSISCAFVASEHSALDIGLQTEEPTLTTFVTNR